MHQSQRSGVVALVRTRPCAAVGAAREDLRVSEQTCAKSCASSTNYRRLVAVLLQAQGRCCNTKHVIIKTLLKSVIVSHGAASKIMAVADGLPAKTSAPSRTLFKVGAAAIVFMCLTIVIVDIYEIPGRQSFFLSIGNRVSTQHYGTKHDALAKPTSTESSELAAARVRCLPPAAWRSLGTLAKLVCLV